MLPDMPIARRTVTTLAVVAVAAISISISGSSSSERTSKSALAAETAPSPTPRSAALILPDAGPNEDTSTRLDPEDRMAPAARTLPALVATSLLHEATPAPRSEAPLSAAPNVVAPRPTPDRPTMTPAIKVATPTASPTRASCPADWFCYERLGIAGPIVPYTDCTGRTDIGVGIRSFSCLSDGYLLGHGYTAFGRITEWKAGDRISSRGREYLVTGAFTQVGCTGPRVPLAPLTLQTSLTATACGPILIVQAQ